MSKLKFLWLVAVMIAFVACDNDNDPKEEPKTPIEKQTYVGTVSVDQNDGTFHTQEEVTVVIEMKDDNKMEMELQKVSFSPKMGAKIDMTVSDIPAVSKTEELTFGGENIIPYAMGGPFEMYKITGFTGKATDEEISFSMTCGPFPLTFKGFVKK